MTTLRFDSKTTVLDLIGLLSEQEGLTNEEAEDYVVRTPDAILSPDVHLRSLSLYSMVRICILLLLINPLFSLLTSSIANEARNL